MMSAVNILGLISYYLFQYLKSKKTENNKLFDDSDTSDSGDSDDEENEDANKSEEESSSEDESGSEGDEDGSDKEEQKKRQKRKKPEEVGKLVAHKKSNKYHLIYGDLTIIENEIYITNVIQMGQNHFARYES